VERSKFAQQISGEGSAQQSSPVFAHRPHDPVNHALKILRQLMIPEAEDQIPFAPKQSIAGVVVRSGIGLRVLTSVKFHDDAMRMVNEVKNVVSKRRLSPEAVAMVVQHFQSSP
jgi:hypothetical protein